VLQMICHCVISFLIKLMLIMPWMQDDGVIKPQEEWYLGAPHCDELTVESNGLNPMVMNITTISIPTKSHQDQHTTNVK
jgi:hypothetical protein